MAKMPRGSKLIYNPSSAAPGFIIKNVISLPGVPSILNSMIENSKNFLSEDQKFLAQHLIYLQLKAIFQKNWKFCKERTKNLLI